MCPGAVSVLTVCNFFVDCDILDQVRVVSIAFEKWNLKLSIIIIADIQDAHRRRNHVGWGGGALGRIE